MADRLGQIKLLLGSRFDYLYEPETFTGKVVRRSVKRGEAPSRWQPCPRCDGAGEVRDRFGAMVACDRCSGRRGTMVDAYTGEAVASERQELELGELIRRDTRTVRCPDCQDLSGSATGQIRGKPCRRCGGSGEAAVAGSWLSEPLRLGEERLGGDPESAMLNAIERRRQAGSYRELDEALAGISRHVNKPPVFYAVTVNATLAKRLLDELYLPPVTRTELGLTPFERAIVDLTLAYVDGRMPDPIRVPADIVANQKVLAHHRTVVRGRQVGEQALRRRDREIRALLREGRGVQWVAQAYGLHVSTVYGIAKSKENAA